MSSRFFSTRRVMIALARMRTIDLAFMTCDAVGYVSTQDNLVLAITSKWKTESFKNLHLGPLRSFGSPFWTARAKELQALADRLGQRKLVSKNERNGSDRNPIRGRGTGSGFEFKTCKARRPGDQNVFSRAHNF